MTTYNYYEIDINDEQSFSLVNKDAKEINLTIPPTRGCLVLIDKKYYSVVDVILQDNTIPTIIVMSVNDEVPTIYKSMIK